MYVYVWWACIYISTFSPYMCVYICLCVHVCVSVGVCMCSACMCINICVCLCMVGLYIYLYVSKVGERSRGRLEGSLFNSYNNEV